MSMVATPRPSRTPRGARRTDEGSRRHLRVVEDPRRRPRRWLWSSVALSMVGALLFLAVAFHVRLITGQQHIAELEKQAQEAQHTYDRLRVEVDGLSAPRRIVARARSLGMVEVGGRTWLAPGSGSAIDDPTTGDSTLRDYLDVKPYLTDTP